MDHPKRTRNYQARSEGQSLGNNEVHCRKSATRCNQWLLWPMPLYLVYNLQHSANVKLLSKHDCFDKNSSSVVFVNKPPVKRSAYANTPHIHPIGQPCLSGRKDYLSNQYLSSQSYWKIICILRGGAKKLIFHPEKPLNVTHAQNARCTKVPCTSASQYSTVDVLTPQSTI